MLPHLSRTGRGVSRAARAGAAGGSGPQNQPAAIPAPARVPRPQRGDDRLQEEVPLHHQELHQDPRDQCPLQRSILTGLRGTWLQ